MIAELYFIGVLITWFLLRKSAGPTPEAKFEPVMFVAGLVWPFNLAFACVAYIVYLYNDYFGGRRMVQIEIHEGQVTRVEVENNKRPLEVQVLVDPHF